MGSSNLGYGPQCRVTDREWGGHFPKLLEPRSLDSHENLNLFEAQYDWPGENAGDLALSKGALVEVRTCTLGRSRGLFGC